MVSPPQWRKDPDSPRASRLALTVLTVGLVACQQTADARQLTANHSVADTLVRKITDSSDLCVDCIRLDSILTLVGDGKVYVSPTESVVRDLSGRYWAGQSDGAIKVFDTRGTFLRTVGRQGGGPMEFEDPKPLFVDSLGRVHILDPAQLRASVVSSSFALLGEKPLPGVVRGAAFLGGSGSARYVVSMWLPTESGLGIPLHIVDGAKVIKSFGADRVSGTATPFTNDRLVSVGASRRIVSARRFDFFIELWSSNGENLGAYERSHLNAEEVPPGLVTSRFLANRVLALQESRENQLWVLSTRVREDWRKRTKEIVLPDGRVALRRDGKMSDLYQTVVEVIDLASAKVVGRRAFSAHLGSFADRSLIVENRETDPAGEPRLVIWSATFQRGRVP